MAGSYEALTGGQTGDALVDFTGGLSETFDVQSGGLVDNEEKKLELYEVCVAVISTSYLFIPSMCRTCFMLTSTEP